MLAHLPLVREGGEMHRGAAAAVLERVECVHGRVHAVKCGALSAHALELVQLAVWRRSGGVTHCSGSADRGARPWRHRAPLAAASTSTSFSRICMNSRVPWACVAMVNKVKTGGRRCTLPFSRPRGRVRCQLLSPGGAPPRTGREISPAPCCSAESPGKWLRSGHRRRVQALLHPRPRLPLWPPTGRTTGRVPAPARGDICPPSGMAMGRPAWRKPARRSRAPPTAPPPSAAA